MKINDKTRKIVAFIGAVLLACVVVFYFLYDKGSDIDGTWYAYDFEREEKPTTLTLNKDGTYNGENRFIDDGKYRIDGERIVLTDNYGFNAGTIEIIEDNGKKALFVSEDLIYYRTLDEADTAKEIRKKEIEERKTLYVSTVKQILTKGDWKYGELGNLSESTRKISMKFTETEFEVDNGTDLIAYTYEIVYVEIKEGENEELFIITWNVGERGTSSSRGYVDLIIRNENEYSISSQFFPYTRTYSKKIDIILEDH